MGVCLRLTAAASPPPPDEGIGGGPPIHSALAVPSGEYIVEDAAMAHNLANAFRAINFMAKVLPLFNQHADLPHFIHQITATVLQELLRHGRLITRSMTRSTPYPVHPIDRKQPPVTSSVSPPPGFDDLAANAAGSTHPSEAMGVVDTSSTPSNSR